MSLSESKHSISQAREQRNNNLTTARGTSYEGYKKDFVGKARKLNHEIVGRLHELGFYKKHGQNS